MSRSARPWFIGALLGALTLALTAYLCHQVAVLRGVDVHILQGFLQLRHPVLVGPANRLTALFDVFPYVFLCAVPVVIATRRGRGDVAIAILVLLLGANASTELLKPLTAGPRDWVAVPGVYLSHATWPSGHSTASMSLALAMIISVPQRMRPVVASLMAVLVVGVVYSLLALGWHYPSDVLGGFEMASTWALLVVGLLRLRQTRRPASVPSVARGGSRFSVTQTLWPSALMILIAAGIVSALIAVRPEQVIVYVSARPAFTAGAIAIAALSFACAAGLSLLLRRATSASPGTAPAPTAARPRPLRRSLRG